MALTPERKQKIDNMTEEQLREEHGRGPRYARFQGESYQRIGARLASIDQQKASAQTAKTDVATTKGLRWTQWGVILTGLGIIAAIVIYYLQR